MRIATYQVFDQTISGSIITWYSGSEFNALLGQADFAAIQAFPTNVPNTTTQLTVTFQTSADSQNWVSMSSQSINGTLVNNVSLSGYAQGGENLGGDVFGAHVRLAISLGGVNPSCRLKLYYTGRARSLRA